MVLIVFVSGKVVYIGIIFSLRYVVFDFKFASIIVDNYLGIKNKPIPNRLYAELAYV